MANVGPNQGRRLKIALSRFAAMLITEARDLTGLSFERLDEALGLTAGNSYRYSLYPPRAKTRAPQVGGIQSLENRVAKLLCRPAHLVAVAETREIDASATLYCPPVADLGLPRHVAAGDVQLAYDNYWPTYADLSQFGRFDIQRPWDAQPVLVQAFGWQWGYLWHQAPDEWRQWWCRRFMQLPRHWVLYWCKQSGISRDFHAEALLPLLVQKMSVRPGLIDRWTSQQSVVLPRSGRIGATLPDSSLAGPPGWNSAAATFAQIFLEHLKEDEESVGSLPESCRNDDVT